MCLLILYTELMYQHLMVDKNPNPIKNRENMPVKSDKTNDIIPHTQHLDCLHTVGYVRSIHSLVNFKIVML